VSRSSASAALLSTVLLAGCGAEPARGDVTGAPVTSPSPSASYYASVPPGQWPAPGDAELTVEIQEGPGQPVTLFALDCHPDPAGGTEDPAATCAHLAALADPFAPLAGDVMCTQEYGGPQTARVTGEWDGEPVDLQLSRTDGCAIAQWDDLGPLLPVPVG